MLFNYKALTKDSTIKDGVIEALNENGAIKALQQRGLTIVSIAPAEKKSFWEEQFTSFERVSLRDVVILSRQMATLFTAHVSALRIFQMLAAQSESPILRKKLTVISDDIQSGSSLSNALARHPEAFSPFYVNMVKSGEETGKLSQVFASLADYLDRSYELTTKTRNAFIYPAFVLVTFGAVMILLLTLVFPNLTAILTESGQAIPIYTQAVIGMSEFFIQYGLFLIAVIIIGSGWLLRYVQTGPGKMAWSRFILNVPIIGKVFRKLYLSRVSDNLYTLLSSGISIVYALEISAEVVGDSTYEAILKKAKEQVSNGIPLSDALVEHEEIPAVMVQIIRVGEETGELSGILKTLSSFYKREVDTAVDTLVELIEPILIVVLGLGVGLILASVLIPIFNVSVGI